MSRSYRTDKESVIANRRMKRDSSGSVLLPRIVAHSPRPGDVHPIRRRSLSRILSLLPIEYVYGLRRIELRARKNDLIGKPFGCYLPGEKTIILYSLPLVWELDRISPTLRESVEANGGDVESMSNGFKVHWPNELSLLFWCWMEILMHELGHHFMYQYRNKNKVVRGALFREFLADQHARRFRKAFIAKLGRGRLRGA